MYSGKRIKRSPKFAQETLVSQTPRYDEDIVDNGIGSLPKPQYNAQQDLYLPSHDYQAPVQQANNPYPMVEPQLDQMQTIMNRLQTPRVQEEIPLPPMMMPEYRQLQFQQSPMMTPEDLYAISQLNRANMQGANAALDEVQYNPQVQAANTYRQVVNPLMGGMLGMLGMGGARRNMELTDKSIYNDTKSYYDMMDNVAARRMALSKQAYDQQQDYDPYTIANQQKRIQSEGYMNQVMNSYVNNFNRAGMDRYKAQVQAQNDAAKLEHQDTADLMNAMRLRDSGRRMDLQDKQYQEKVRQWEEKVAQFNKTYGLKERMEDGRNTRFDKGEAGKAARQGVSESGKNTRQQTGIDARIEANNMNAQNRDNMQTNAQKFAAWMKGKNQAEIPQHNAPVQRLTSEQQSIREQQVAFAQEYKASNPKATMEEIRAAWSGKKKDPVAQLKEDWGHNKSDFYQPKGARPVRSENDLLYPDKARWQDNYDMPDPHSKYGMTKGFVIENPDWADEWTNEIDNVFKTMNGEGGNYKPPQSQASKPDKASSTGTNASLKAKTFNLGAKSTSLSVGANASNEPPAGLYTKDQRRRLFIDYMKNHWDSRPTQAQLSAFNKRYILSQKYEPALNGLHKNAPSAL